ncbi:hypothetical protein NPIL_638901 [Nephila pilipes]|uniref:Uncharacterized protein n=1 Tax=Nephila pilipes TaxID=299642 RepID=A0A8X6NF07_NEPPI|nr:hypothetical protein NPIL_638901 [Nephila pilipes]
MYDRINFIVQSNYLKPPRLLKEIISYGNSEGIGGSGCASDAKQISTYEALKHLKAYCGARKVRKLDSFTGDEEIRAACIVVLYGIQFRRKLLSEQ